MSAPLSRAQWRQIGFLTAGAAVLLAGMHFFRSRPDLTHLDFVAGGPGALEFCNAADPRFLPVIERSSPVAMALTSRAPATVGEPVDAVLVLRTNTGKPIGPGDLQLTATHPLNLWIVDPGLVDFHAVQPQPGARAGEWRFVFTPNRPGAYRIFADFTPKATGAEMYASADLPVAAKPGEAISTVSPTATGFVEGDGLRYTLSPAHAPVRAREPFELNFAVTRSDGGEVSLQPIDGTRARLVAFDQDRTGFVSLSPDPDAAATPEGKQPRLAFKVTISDPGKYFIWSRINDGRTEVAGPFSLAVVP